MRRNSWHTDFTSESPASFWVRPTRINSASEGTRLRHQQAASILRLASGELLVTCRWDEHGDSEGDASNEQALYFSRDGGSTWRMANGGEPIVTLEQGTSFTLPSAITHSFVFEDDSNETWLYYTINQPYTWGAGKPARSTGGGEIRRIRLESTGGDWLAAGESEIVWGFMQPVADGRGGLWEDVRVLCLNGIVRLRSGRLLMPIAGRSTVPEPEGAFWRLDRAWVLSSDDRGATWTGCHFMGGGGALALCEPTIVETSSSDHLVAYLRSQYDTGFELYRSESRDAGHSWSPPLAAGLPNTGGSGTKPYLLGLSTGHYALLQTNEHDITDRTNVSLFLTDEDGLRDNRWPLVKALSAECREHWLGSAYGWLAEEPGGGIHSVWVSFTPDANHLNYALLDFDWLGATVVEPLSPSDSRGDDLPRLVTRQESRQGETDMPVRGLEFPSLRSRAHASHLGDLEGRPYEIRLRFRVDGPPDGAFPLLDLRARHGRERWLSLDLRPDGTVWIRANAREFDSGIGAGQGELPVLVEVLSAREARLTIAGRELGSVYSTSWHHPNTLYIGGNHQDGGRCNVLLLEAGYGISESAADATGDGAIVDAVDEARPSASHPTTDGPPRRTGG